MKYEAPICENVRLEKLDIICTSGYPNEDPKGDTPGITIPTLDQNLDIA
jgi:hypothetical protein